MTLSVVTLDEDPAAQVQWDSYVESHPAATPYHLRAWQRIFGDGLGYRSSLLLARDSSGAPHGALPLYVVPSPWKRRLVAVPFRDRGGPLWDDDAAFDALLGRSKELARECGADAIVLKTHQPLPGSSGRHGLARIDHWIHSVLDLGGIDDALLWKRIGGKTRNMIRQAESHGVELRRATMDANAAQRWHLLHLCTQKRLGVPPFPRRFFAQMLEALTATGGIELLEAVRAGEPCAATLLLLHRDTCIYGYSASTGAGQRMRANDLVLHGAIRLALKRGMRRFDLGSDSPLQQSLLLFKRKWGATQSTIPLYATGGAGGVSDSSAGRYAFARMILRRLPLGVLDALGNRVTRYFG